MNDRNSVTVDFQEEKILVSHVKHLFEDVVKAYPSTKNRLGSDANIIHDRNFESAV